MTLSRRCLARRASRRARHCCRASFICSATTHLPDQEASSHSLHSVKHFMQLAVCCTSGKSNAGSLQQLEAAPRNGVPTLTDVFLIGAPPFPMFRLFKTLATLRTDAPLFREVEVLRWRGCTARFASGFEEIGAPHRLTRIAELSRSAASLNTVVDVTDAVCASLGYSG